MVRSPLTAPVLWAVGLLAAVTLLHFRDPHQSGSYAFCPWLLLTGTYCPGCGGLRAVHDLTDGDLAGAVSSNLLVVAMVPVAALLWTRWARARWQGRARAGPPVRTSTAAPFARPATWALLVVVPAFGLLRNLPFAGWLAP